MCMVCICTISCTEQQDFDQFDDLDIIPTLESSILYLETSEDIINRIVGVNFFTKSFNFDAFSEKFFSDSVIDGVVTYEVVNTTSKAMDLTLEFLDESDVVLDTELFQMPPAPTPILQRDVIYGAAGKSIDIIKNTSSIRVSANNLGDNTSISSLPSPQISLKSSAKFRVRLK